jgi:ApaG protein
VFTSEATTRGIRVRTASSYVPERSQPDLEQWFFRYTVEITNDGQQTAQLLRRHWIITDANGQTGEVEGEGVIGKQPLLGPGDTFSYTSACPMQTPFGTMHGTYRMVTDSGEHFDIEIAPFLLGRPQAVQ